MLETDLTPLLLGLALSAMLLALAGGRVGRLVALRVRRTRRRR